MHRGREKRGGGGLVLRKLIVKKKKEHTHNEMNTTPPPSKKNIRLDSQFTVHLFFYCSFVRSFVRRVRKYVYTTALEVREQPSPTFQRGLRAHTRGADAVPCGAVLCRPHTLHSTVQIRIQVASPSMCDV